MTLLDPLVRLDMWPTVPIPSRWDVGVPEGYTTLLRRFLMQWLGL